MSVRPNYSRRDLMKSAIAASVAASLVAEDARCESSTAIKPCHQRILDFLASHARSDGGYAWQDQNASHLTPTFAVLGCFQALGRLPPNRRQLADFVRTHHPRELKKLEQEHRDFDRQQIQSLVWLGEDVSAFRNLAQTWKEPYVYLKQYEKHGYPVFRSEAAVFTCRAMLGLSPDELNPAFIQYLDSRRRPNGSFNNTPADDGSEGHVLNTLWGLQGLQTLNRLDENRQASIDWLQDCQLKSGGFTWSPQPSMAGTDDVAYTWAAVRALKMLDALPRDVEACIGYLHSLWQTDGGFSDRPNWQPNPLATYYALDTLQILDALDSLEKVGPKPTHLPSTIGDEMRVYSILIEAHGQGSPTEAVALARDLKIHLWGAKNAKPEWIARAQQIADAQHVAVQFFVANEEYGTWVDIAGMGTYSHTSDVIFPVAVEAGESLADQGPVTWDEFHRRRFVPLQRSGGRLIWQFGENEELVRLYLDDSLERGGYAAISTFHFGNPDFTNSEPFLKRWQGQIPFIAIHDAHGREAWWFSDQVTGFRTLFAAKEPTWSAWLEALNKNRVAAVRHDAASNHQTWMHGSRSMLDFVRTRELDWRWWDNPSIQRPAVSLVAVQPNDPFEVASSDEGVTLRVRCAWENTTQGAPKTPITELVSLRLDDQSVFPQLASIPSSRGGGRSDHYHSHVAKNLSPGKHQATVVVRSIKTRQESSQTIDFFVPR